MSRTPLSATITPVVIPHARDQRELGGAVDLEALEVARVDADHLGLESDRSLKLLVVVRLHERLDLEALPLGHQGADVSCPGREEG